MPQNIDKIICIKEESGECIAYSYGWFDDDSSYLVYPDVRGFFYHREDGPAYIIYSRGGSIKKAIYLLNNKNHRIDGPAYDYYNTSGSA